MNYGIGIGFVVFRPKPLLRNICSIYSTAVQFRVIRIEQVLTLKLLWQWYIWTCFTVVAYKFTEAMANIRTIIEKWHKHNFSL